MRRDAETGADSPVCRICLESEDLHLGQVCACRGSSGCHLGCLVKLAESGWPRLERWSQCPTCKVQYIGEAKLHLAQVLWAKLQDLPQHAVPRLYACSHLSSSLYGQGRHLEAATLTMETLAIRQTHFGAEHPDTLASQSVLSSIFYAMAKYNEATALDKNTWQVRKRVLGPEHPDTLASANNLANTLRVQGLHAEAAEMHRFTLQSKRKILGNDHPDTLVSASNLANTLYAQGKYCEASVLDRMTLETRDRVLGGQHPDTLASANNLANTLRQQGSFEEAEALLRGALVAKRVVLGGEHPDTLVSASNLARTLCSQGRFKEASALDRETLAIRDRVLGPRHPGTLASMSNLGNTLMVMGHLEEAVEVLARTTELRRSCIGAQHPDTLVTSRNLAKAEALLERLRQRNGYFAERRQAEERRLATAAEDTGLDGRKSQLFDAVQLHQHVARPDQRPGNISDAEFAIIERAEMMARHVSMQKTVWNQGEIVLADDSEDDGLDDPKVAVPFPKIESKRHMHSERDNKQLFATSVGASYRSAVEPSVPGREGGATKARARRAKYAWKRAQCCHGWTQWQ